MLPHASFRPPRSVSAGTGSSSSGCRRSSSSTSWTSGCGSGRRGPSHSSLCGTPSDAPTIRRARRPASRRRSRPVRAPSRRPRHDPGRAGLPQPGRKRKRTERVVDHSTGLRVRGQPPRVREREGAERGPQRAGTNECERVGKLAAGRRPRRRSQSPRAAGVARSSCAHSGISVLTKSCTRSSGAGAGVRPPAAAGRASRPTQRGQAAPSTWCSSYPRVLPRASVRRGSGLPAHAVHRSARRFPCA